MTVRSQWDDGFLTKRFEWYGGSQIRLFYLRLYFADATITLPSAGIMMTTPNLQRYAGHSSRQRSLNEIACSVGLQEMIGSGLSHTNTSGLKGRGFWRQPELRLPGQPRYSATCLSATSWS